MSYYNGYFWKGIDSSLGLPTFGIMSFIVTPDGLVIILTDRNRIFFGNQHGFQSVQLRYNNVEIRPLEIAYYGTRQLLVRNQDNKLYWVNKDFTGCAPVTFFKPDEQVFNLLNTQNGKVWIQTSDALLALEHDTPVVKISAPVKGQILDILHIVEDSSGEGMAEIANPLPYRGLWQWHPHSLPVKTQEGKRHLIQTLALRGAFIPLYSYIFGEVRARINNEWRSVSPLPEEMTNILLFSYRPNGDLWVARESGLYLFRAVSPLWNYFRFPSPSKANITSELLITTDGSLWRGTDSGIVIHEPNGRLRFLDSIQGQKLIAITGLGQDKEGNIWVSSGLSFKGAYRWNGKQWKYYGEQQGLPTTIHRIKSDRTGRLWFLGLAQIYNDTLREPGAFLYEHGKFSQWGTKQGLLFGRVYAFSEGLDGSYWFGTNGGIARWKNNRWTYWTTKNGLASDRIFTLAIDSSNTVWFSHQSYGLGFIRNGEIGYLTSSEGLINDLVWEIKIDPLNRLWAGTTNGLSCYDHGLWYNFDENIGLSPRWIWPIIPLKDKVYLGTVGGGFAILHLDYLNQQPPSVVQLPPVVEKNSVFFRWKPFSFWGELPTHAIETRFQLDDGEWSEWNTVREKTYLELSSGSHHFTVQAKSAFGKIVPMGYSVVITIEQPYYLKPRYFLPLLFLSCGLITLGVIYLLRKRNDALKLKLSELRYRGIIEDQIEMILRFTPDGRVIFANDSFYRFFKTTQEKIEGNYFFETIPTHKKVKIIEHLAFLTTLTPANPTSTFTDEVVLESGEIRWLEWRERALFDDNGNLVEFQSTARDVTEQKQMETALRQSEHDYRGLFENAHDAIIIFNPDDEVILEANQRACEIYGFERDEFIGMSLTTISENVPLGKERVSETLAKGFQYQFETIQYKKNRDKMYLDINASVINYQGQAAILSINRDVTNKKLTELAIARREAILEALGYAGQQFMEAGTSLDEKIQNVIMRLGVAANVSRVYIFQNYRDSDGAFLTSQRYEWAAPGVPSQANNPELQNFSYESSGFTRWVELLGKRNPLYGIIEDFPDRERVVLEKQHIHSIIVMPIFVNNAWWGHIGFDEYTKDRRWSAAEIDALSVAANIIGAAIERQQREKTVNMLAYAIKGISECVSITDLENNLLFVNNAFCSTYGYLQPELLGKNISIVSSSSNPPPLPEILSSTIQGAWQGEIINKKKDGTEFPIYLSTSQVKDEQGFPIALIGVATDISERKRVEKQLREQASLLNISTDAIILEDMNHAIVHWNPAAERLYGWQSNEIFGKNSLELLLEKEEINTTQLVTTLLSKGEWRGELKQRAKDGRTITVDSRYVLIRDESGRPVSTLIVNTDITDKKILEEQLFRAQRLESIGTLAGGIAHDLNNVLTPILLSTEILKYRFPDEQSRIVISTLETSAERGKDIIKQVLTFARGMTGERIVLRPNDVISEIIHIVRQTFPKSLQLLINLAPDLMTIIGDPTQFHQALLNLAVNARDAMPKGGILTFTAQNAVIDELFARTHLNAKPGTYVSISVSDNGAGIAQEHLDKIFDPFFTTKEIGKGTGLGLSTVHAIVKGHGGFITVSSKLNEGSTFTLFLPVSHDALTERPVQSINDVLRGNGELILVVDDEEAIQGIARETLEMYGYTVITANDGTEAVALFVQQLNEIRLVVTDILMPYMDGISLIRSLRQIQPSVPILAASGQETDAQFLAAGGVTVQGFIPKPYSAEHLLASIHSVLHKPS